MFPQNMTCVVLVTTMLVITHNQCCHLLWNPPLKSNIFGSCIAWLFRHLHVGHIGEGKGGGAYSPSSSVCPQLVLGLHTLVPVRIHACVNVRAVGPGNWISQCSKCCYSRPGMCVCTINTLGGLSNSSCGPRMWRQVPYEVTPD